LKDLIFTVTPSNSNSLITFLLPSPKRTPEELKLTI
jgi:hypothetical protein